MALTCDEIANLTSGTGTAIKRLSCPHCGTSHTTTCPRIRAIEYHQDGTVKRVEFHTYAPVVSGHNFVAGETPAR